MKGGAYGVYLTKQKVSGNSVFLTYRDPSPFSSIETFFNLPESLNSFEVSEEEAVSAVTGLYSNFAEPSVPRQKAKEALINYIFGYEPGEKSSEAKKLLSLTQKDFKTAAKDLFKAKKAAETVVFCPQSHITKEIAKKCRKIIKLTL